jgi:hypothetical protein
MISNRISSKTNVNAWLGRMNARRVKTSVAVDVFAYA